MVPLVFQDPFFTDRKRVTQVPRLDGSNNPRSQNLGQNFGYRLPSRLEAGINGIFFSSPRPACMDRRWLVHGLMLVMEGTEESMMGLAFLTSCSHIEESK